MEAGGGQAMRAEFVGDEDLSYDRNRFRGGTLELDPAYRLMHLPLVNPDHPDVRPASEDGAVEMGRFKTPRKSLVAFLDWSVFRNAPAVPELIDRVSSSAVGAKVDFSSFDLRRDRLHFTISALQSDTEVAAVMRALGPMPRFRVRLGNLWAGGSVNTGRLYLPVYPERDADGNVVNKLQAAAGLRRSDFFGLGFFNLRDHLNAAESAVLLALIEGFADRPLFDTTVEELAVIETHDSLLLDFRILHRLALS